MPRLSKCIVCKNERYNMNIRDGEVYNKNGNRKMNNTGYKYCPSCDTVYDADDKVFSTKTENIRKDIIKNITEEFNRMKLVETNQNEVDGRYIGVLNEIVGKVVNMITQGFKAYE